MFLAFCNVKVFQIRYFSINEFKNSIEIHYETIKSESYRIPRSLYKEFIDRRIVIKCSQKINRNKDERKIHIILQKP